LLLLSIVCYIFMVIVGYVLLGIYVYCWLFVDSYIVVLLVIGYSLFIFIVCH